MEKLQQLLITYAKQYCANDIIEEWGLQFFELPFPKYWHALYSILRDVSKEMIVVEIGSGYGDVTSIPLSLGFAKVYGFERRQELCGYANAKLETLFERSNVITLSDFKEIEMHADILLMVNCVYADDCKSKRDYLDKIRDFYDKAHQPKLFVYEAIDDSYNLPDNTFPYFVRLNINDIRDTFPCTQIKTIETSVYPYNKRSKTLYIIEKNENINPN